MRAKTKVWLEDEEGNVVFGGGRVRILQKLEELGSLNQVSKSLNMSYRAVWGKVKATEERLGEKIVESKVGGGRDGGSRLTRAGRDLLERFLELERLSRNATDRSFKDLFNNPPDRES